MFMTHYAGHRRDAFIEWLESGLPDPAHVEVDFQPETQTRLEFLWDLLQCTDILPSYYRSLVAERFGFPPDHWRISTYGDVARELLVACEEGRLDPQGDWSGGANIGPGIDAEPMPFDV